MVISTGIGRLAYKLHLGGQAKIEDLVDIFDCVVNLKFVTINQQLTFYEDWFKSL
jgi:hypothetical protein